MTFMSNPDSINREFKGIWIPKEIWLDKKISFMGKLLLAEINSLQNTEGCYASNDYFSDFFNLTKRRIRDLILELKENGYIQVKFVYKNGTKQIEKRIITINRYDSLSQPPNQNINLIHDNSKIQNSTLNSENSNKYQNIMILYNTICTNLPKAKKMSTKRKKQIDVLFKRDYTSEKLAEIFKIAQNNDFLCGKAGDRNWNADFEWLLNENNILKVLEGRYRNYQRNTNLSEVKTQNGYGEYKNVILTDEEISNLKSKLQKKYDEYLERLSQYMASTGKTYASHSATILSWYEKDLEKEKKYYNLMPYDKNYLERKEDPSTDIRDWLGDDFCG